MPFTGNDIITAAFMELNILGAAEVLTAEDAAFGLDKVNRLIDNWNKDHGAAYCDTFTLFTLTPSAQPHTIGPGSNFPITQRPPSIEAISLVLTGNVYFPLRSRDAQWWASQTVPKITSTLPTDYYYEEDWPQGKIFFWPVPTVANQVQVQMRVPFASLTLAGVFDLPQGYRDAIILTLAESLGPAYPNAVVSQGTIKAGIEARARIFPTNTKTPLLDTRDSGMPGGRGSRGNYLTGFQ